MTESTNRQALGVESQPNPSHSVPTGTLLTIDRLTVDFGTAQRPLRAVDNVSLRMERGEILGLVGESGSGKSTLGMSILGLVPPPGRVSAGRVIFDGRDLLALDESQMRELRGATISLIVQDALAVMNPVKTVQEQVGHIVRDHEGGSRVDIRTRVLNMLERVHIPNVSYSARSFAHQLSGGMQQRVVIAEGLILGPELVVADEPTTALDVSIQAQILDLIREARDVFGASILFITHDLAIVAELCDRVAVMYAGKLVEVSDVKDLFAHPQHPYTRALVGGLLPLTGDPPETLRALPGHPPQPEAWPTGCRFHPRCSFRSSLPDASLCADRQPLADETAAHWATCHFLDVERGLSETAALSERDRRPDG